MLFLKISPHSKDEPGKNSKNSPRPNSRSSSMNSENNFKSLSKTESLKQPLSLETKSKRWRGRRRNYKLIVRLENSEKI
jgi:hypothetical protein